MFNVTKYPEGTFSWADCSSSDVSKAKPFYAAVMGWAIEDVPLGNDQFYTMYSLDAANTAGLSGMPPGMEDHPSYWSSYVTVDDVDAMTARAKELGATVIASPFDVFDSGRMSTIQDPTGAMVSLWQAKNHIGSGIVNKAGAMTWNELATRDVEGAKKFYSDLFGWTYVVDEKLGYTSILNKGRMNGGVMPMDESHGDAQPFWMVYWSVADIDDTVAKAKANGGTLLYDVMDVEGVGKFTSISDPSGAVSSFMQSPEPQEWDVEA